MSTPTPLADAIESIIVEMLGFGPPIKGFDSRAVATRIADVVPRFMPKPEPKRAPALTLRLDTSDLERVVSEFHQTVTDFREALAALPTEDDPE